MSETKTPSDESECYVPGCDCMDPIPAPKPILLQQRQMRGRVFMSNTEIREVLARDESFLDACNRLVAESLEGFPLQIGL